MICVSDEELNKIKTFSTSSYARSASQYARKVLLQQPVLVKYRNESVDELLFVMIGLKNELSTIGNQFNEAVQKLHTLDKVLEIKLWLLQNEPLKQSFLDKTEAIRLRMIQIHEQWSQK